MSLVGTRPPTVDEWDKYELHHRARLATKPGLTGMWQVSSILYSSDYYWTSVFFYVFIVCKC
ncbi:sugar transferase [Anaerobutyricum soehngenii]|nr:sugar transferase [Anaerobutyricum soehngenii]MCG4697178.1 sugar transferase [Anaerobutyricum soehngenii]